MATAISETADTFTTASKEFSQQGVCPYFHKETSRRDLLAEVLVRVYTPVVAGVIYLLHWLSIPMLSRAMKSRRSCTGQIKSTGIVAILLLRVRTPFKQPLGRCSGAADTSFASRPVAPGLSSVALVTSAGVSIILLPARGQPRRCRSRARIGRSTNASASVLVVVVGALVTLSPRAAVESRCVPMAGEALSTWSSA